MKKRNHFEMSARLFYAGSILLLLISGFLLEWLVKDKGFWHSAFTVLLPALPAVLVYALEHHYHVLDSTPRTLKNKHYLPIALSILLICYGEILRDDFYSLNLYWAFSYLLCCYMTYVALLDAPGIRCGMFLVQTMLFGYLSIYRDTYAGGSIAIAVMSIFLMPCMAAKEQEDPLALPAAALTLIFMILGSVVPVFEKLLYTAVPQETAIVLDSFRNLLPHVRVFGQTQLPFAEYEGLMFGHQLGYLLSRWGWVAAVPVALAVLCMVISGFRLADTGKHVSVLCFGCQMLLVLRLVSALLYLPSVVMGLCDDIPFLGGDTAQRIADYLLCAMVLLPVAQTELEKLDPKDPDFEVRERNALQALHHNRTGLTRLCRYVYNNPDTLEGWLFLFDKYFDLMDDNTMNIMARNADAVLPPEVFRENFLSMVPLVDEKDAIPLDVYEALDVKDNFCTDGVFLSHYLGVQEKLVIPPFWLAIGENALANKPCLRAVSVPNTVLRICENAFRDCDNLTSVELRKGLLALDDYAFRNTGLTQIRLPSKLEDLGKGCFQNTALHTVKIPGTVQIIPKDCFAENLCLETVTLEEGVRAIGPGAFRNCSALRSVSIPNSIEFIHSSAFDGCTALVDVEMGEDWKNRSAIPLLPVLFPQKEEEAL